MNIQEIHQDNRIDQFFTERWGGDFIVSRGERLYGHDLDGLAVFDGAVIIALLTYHTKYDECEIVTLDSRRERQGIATALIEKMLEKSKSMPSLKRIWLMTTNDNTDAMRFYQKRGFVFKDVYPNAIEKSRKLKQPIPEFGNNGIPIRDEIELEYLLK